MNDTDSTGAPDAASEERPSRYRLITNYWDRYDLVVEEMKDTDAAGSANKKRDEAEARQFEAGDRLTEAEQAVCAFVPEWTIDAKLKTDFVRILASNNGGSLDESLIESLLSTLPRLVLVDWKGLPS